MKNTVKVVCLGNEFVKGDSFAKKVGDLLKKDFEVVNIEDSFQLMGAVGSGGNFIVLDVVEGLNEVKGLSIGDLKVDSISSAHDFDAGYVLKLLGKDVRIIGIPTGGDLKKVRNEVVGLIGKL